jgi:pentose-5-phosphate-3-epimerase
MPRVAPSILSADFARLGDEVRAAERGQSTYSALTVHSNVLVAQHRIGLDTEVLSEVTLLHFKEYASCPVAKFRPIHSLSQLPS